jgi:single-stranded DNA-binding protein
VVVGRLQQRAWTAEDGSARSVVEVVAEELGPSLRWATAIMTRATRSQDQWPARPDDATSGTRVEEQQHAGVPLRHGRTRDAMVFTCRA